MTLPAEIPGFDYLTRHLAGELYQIKVLCCEQGVVFGPVEKQHVELSTASVRYRLDGKGNALAGMVYDGTFELRGDARFTPARTAALAARMRLAMLERLQQEVQAGRAPEAMLQRLRETSFTYRGAPLVLPEAIPPCAGAN